MQRFLLEKMFKTCKSPKGHVWSLNRLDPASCPTHGHPQNMGNRAQLAKRIATGVCGCLTFFFFFNEMYIGLLRKD